MFGDLQCPKAKIKTHPKPVPVDIHFPCPVTQNCYAYPGRAANTDQEVRTLIYKQRKDGDYVRATEVAKKNLMKDLFDTRFDKHLERRRFQTEIQKRVNRRLQEYEESIEKKRERLRDLLAKEEREFYWETIDKAQRGDETRFETMKQRAAQLIAKREAEREEIVKQKRIEQYMARCMDLREFYAKKNIMEAKDGQLQQIRENEARREGEREVEKMWHDIAMKEMEAKKEREEYDAINKYQKDKESQKAWDFQIKAQELLKAEEKRMSAEERVELERLQEQMRKEEIQRLLEKRRKRDETDRQLREQIEVQHKYLEQRKKEEAVLEQAFIQLTELELKREKEKQLDTTTVAKREMALYRASLWELEQQNKQDEIKLNQLLEEYRIIIQKKHDEAQCKLEAAKKRLQQDVLKERAEQLKEKEEIAKQELEMKQADEELLRLTTEKNERLAEESKRQDEIARKQYREDLSKQIEYAKVIQEREKALVERQLQVAKLEEERYQQMAKDLCYGNLKVGEKHPFRRLIEQYDCQCPPCPKPPY